MTIADRTLDAGGLVDLVRGLAETPGRLREMGEAARSLARLDATRRIADLADRLLRKERVDVS